MKSSILASKRRTQLWQLCASCQSRYASTVTFQSLWLTPTRTRRFSDSPQRSFSTSLYAAKSNEIWNYTRNNNASSQAYPLSGYYYDLLNNPYPQRPAAQTVRRPEIARQPTAEKELSKEEKMSIVFGTRLAGPGYQSTRYNPETMSPESTWKTINGVPIPPRPSEPDNCCMSGCVHCVWDDYRDDLESWASRVKEAKAKITNTVSNNFPQTDMRQRPREEVTSASASMDDDGGGSETNWELPSSATAGEDELFAGIPVGIREFMKTEKKLREKKKQERNVAD